MPERTVSVGLVADVSNYLANMKRASSATAGLGKTAQTTGELTRGVVSKIGGSLQSLGNQVGGSVGQLLSTVGAGIDTVASKSAKFSTALEVGGGAAFAAGLGLQQLGSGAVQATDQLDAAITAAGDSTEQFSKQIDDAVASGEKFSHNAEDTKQALTTLTASTGSTQKALDSLSVVTNLAAARHSSLASAATLVARVLAGNGGRTLTQYGITMDGVGTKTQQGQRALQELADKLNGQASASVDNFSGKVGGLTTQLEDFVNDAATPVGAALTVVGVAAQVGGFALDLYKLKTVGATGAQAGLTAAAYLTAPALDAEGLAATTTGGALDGLKAAASTAIPVLAALAAADIVGNLAAGAAAAEGASTSIDRLKVSVATFDAKKLKASTAKNFSDNNKAALGQLTGGGPVQAISQVEAGIAANSTVRGGLDISTLGLNESSGGTALANTTASLQAYDAELTSLVNTGNTAKAAELFGDLSAQVLSAGGNVAGLKSQLPDYVAAAATFNASVKDGSDKTSVLAGTFNTAALAAADLKSSTDELESSLKTYGGAAQSAESATEGYYSALDAATEAAKKNGKATDDQTAKGRANNQALYAVAAAANAVADANLKAGKPIEDVSQQLGTARDKFVSLAESMGYTADQAKKLADQLVKAPTKYNFDSGDIKIATDNLRTFLAELARVPQTPTTVRIKTVIGNKTGFADGGIIPGRPSSTDNMLLPMASGEGVATARAMSSPANRAALAAMNAGRSPWGSASSGKYMSASSGGGSVNNYFLSVPVTIGGTIIGSDLAAAKQVTDLVTKGVNAGYVSQNWNVH